MKLEIDSSFEISNHPNPFCTGTPCIVERIEDDNVYYRKYPNHCISEDEKKEIKVVNKKYIEIIKSYY